MAGEQQPAKIGQCHAQAMGRLGLKEIAQALPAFPTGPIQPVEEPGLFGNPVPQEVFAQKQGPELDPDFDMEVTDPFHDLQMDKRFEMEM